ncbi:NRDE family protein [Thiorhodococcus minor]|uniref:NRDE family protein n=1 Tax=Thiorhodococcus minor TaxID=57489 RepID=A0A6M0K127_9GAMM|nr:NRDE family protein [Thiorhodococcus minor]NEV62307.1 NRDE family protein [Thiorhodococcus minor]
MCTLVLLVRPGHDWPVLIAANRDEMAGRASLPPARHWDDRPEVVAGLDVEAGGSWLGVNDHGVVAAVLNREGALGPMAGKRSRGELVLEALDHAEAGEAARALTDLEPRAYRPFNLVVADPSGAYWLRHAGEGDIDVVAIAAGLHLLSATDLDDPAHPRIAAFAPRFAAAPEPDPERGDWEAWSSLLADPGDPVAAGPDAAMLVERPDGFRTRSSALIAIPAYPGFQHRPIWLHAERGADDEAFRAVM